MYLDLSTHSHWEVRFTIWPFAWILGAQKAKYTGYTQKNGAVSKVNKKFISHLTRAQPTPSAVATVQVSHALPAVRFSCLLRGREASFQDGVAAGKGFLCAPFWGVQICDYSTAWSAVHGLEKTHAWETWTVAAADGLRCARVRWEINFLLTFEIAPFFCAYLVYI